MKLTQYYLFDSRFNYAYACMCHVCMSLCVCLFNICYLMKKNKDHLHLVSHLVAASCP